MLRRAFLAAALLLATASPSLAQSVSLSLNDGRVTLITQNATPALILAEWARQGQVRIVDGERVPATPLTLRLENVPEREALDIVLRSAAGYIAAPRAHTETRLSRFDRVIVMATSPGAATARAAAPAAASRATPGAVVPTMPVQAEEPVVQEQPVVQEDASAAAAGAAAAVQVATPEQPASSTNFDYANPQRYFAARQAEQAAAEAAAGSQPTQSSTAAGPAGAFGPTRTSPGLLPAPQPQGNQQQGSNGTGTVNPYGLPPNQTPGSQAAPPMEPDRAKYINPYAPTPPRP